MAVIILESIGFSATHSISDMLSMDGANYVCHGSQNFKKRTIIGNDNLAFPVFLRQLQELKEEHENCISLLSVFQTAEIAQKFRGADASLLDLLVSLIRSEYSAASFV